MKFQWTGLATAGWYPGRVRNKWRHSAAEVWQVYINHQNAYPNQLLTACQGSGQCNAVIQEDADVTQEKTTTRFKQKQPTLVAATF